MPHLSLIDEKPKHTGEVIHELLWCVNGFPMFNLYMTTNPTPVLNQRRAFLLENTVTYPRISKEDLISSQ
jgi:hypothetical protein